MRRYTAECFGIVFKCDIIIPHTTALSNSFESRMRSTNNNNQYIKLIMDNIPLYY